MPALFQEDSVSQQQRPKLTRQQQLHNLLPGPLLQQLAPEQQPRKIVPVYRLHQLSWDSPCLLGDPCPTCALHKECHAGNRCGDCLRGKRYDCERQTPARPAFWATIRAALHMLEWSLATFIHRNTALRLTDDEIAHLRDESCVIDEEVVLKYILRIYRARIAVDRGWGGRSKASKIPRKLVSRYRFHYL
jgi:hypothetical protein